jgi:hypothetical protein
MKEIEVGKKFWYKGKRYRVEKGLCQNCDILKTQEYCGEMHCTRGVDKNVIYKEAPLLIMQLFTRKK